MNYLDYIQDFCEDQIPDYGYLKSIFDKGLEQFI